MQRLRNLLNLKGASAAAPLGTAALPRPKSPVCILGDVHGCLTLLDLMLQRIAQESGLNMARLIFVGDLIDRGPDSCGVLNRVRGLIQAAPERVICLLGNHERMLLDVLDDPARHAPRWLLHGGAETLASYGLSARAPHPGGHQDADFAALAADLRAVLPAGLEAWLRGLPLWWQDGDLVVVHAAADPRRAMAAQTEQTLLWGHRDFRKLPRRDGLWLAHGHVIVPAAVATAGRIAVDTGAYKTGRLSAAWLSKDGVRFLEVSAA